jgi:hypothetical protein
MSDGARVAEADSCSGAFARTFCLDFLNPACTFQQFLRKMAVVQGFVFCIAAAVYIALFAWEMSTRPDGSVRTVLYIVSLLTTGIPFAVIYAHVYRVGTVSDFIISAQLFVSAVFWLLVAYYSPGRLLVTYGIMNSAITAAMVSMPHMRPLCALLFVAYVLSTYNYAALVTRQIEPIAAPGWQRPNFIGVFVNGITGATLMLIIIVCAVLQAKHFLRVLATAEAAVDLSRTAAALLRDYDTGAVSALLAEYARVPEHDADILGSYEALVANLNRYRPHLPNWMVRQGDDDGLDDATSSQERAARAANVLRPSANGRCDSASSTGSRRSSTASHRSNRSAGSPEPLVAAGRAASTVAFALVDFRATDGGPSEAVRGAVTRFVDALHHVATATQAAIHTFVGDTVQLSGNAAARCAHLEVKAARFLARLKAATDFNAATLGGVTVSAAAMSGPASHQFGGSGNVSAFVLSLPWRAKLLACFALAKRHRAFVCSGSLAVEAEHVLRSRAVELLAVTINGEEAAVVVHEVVGQRARADTDDDWMYVQGGADERSVGALPDALQLCVDGFYGDALAALGPPAARESALVANLRARADAARVARPATFGARLCICDDTM